MSKSVYEATPIMPTVSQTQRCCCRRQRVTRCLSWYVAGTGQRETKSTIHNVQRSYTIRLLDRVEWKTSLIPFSVLRFINLFHAVGLLNWREYLGTEP